MNFSEELKKVIRGQDLSEMEVRAFVNETFQGVVDEIQIAGMLSALATKSESSSEIAGFAKEMRVHMSHVDAPHAIDIVGTGGDGSGTFNISTAAVLVAAGAGAKIAKHGNKAASSKSGSADVLQALGVNIVLTPPQAEKVYQKAGIVFLMAPLFHPAMRAVVNVRTILRVRTIFNILGPLVNPAGTDRQLVGVPSPQIAERMAEAATQLGYERLLIVTSEDGMDEISLGAKTRGYDIRGKVVTTFTIDPEAYGFKKTPKGELNGGTAEENAEIIRGILAGKKNAARDVVVLNAGFALSVAGVAQTPEEGITLAEKSIDSGSAARVLELLIAETQKFAPAHV